MRANIPGRSPSPFARDVVTAGVTRCPCQRPPAPSSWTMSAVPGGAGEAAGNAPGPTGEVPPAIRETSASTSLRPPLATSFSCSCSDAKRSMVAAPAPTEGSDVGGVDDAHYRRWSDSAPAYMCVTCYLRRWNRGGNTPAAGRCRRSRRRSRRFR